EDKPDLLMITIDRKNSERYQGIIDANGLSISEAMERYFIQSEQIGTCLKLAIGKVISPDKAESWVAGGIMIQKLPEVNELTWEEAKAFFNTIRDDELLDPNLSQEKLLYSLYHEMEVIAYDSIKIIYKCRCSKEKAIQIIISLGYDNIKDYMIDNKISIDCQFCNKSQKFSLKQVKNILNIS
ncbi:MAG: Hsp33 family molecular chaperone HslO, partial [Pseudomonadota bacterium]